jgi:hypothetical protein
LTGATGATGAAGAAATIAVGTVTTGAAGSSVTVTNSGTSAAAVFDISIPRGATGAAGSDAFVAVGTTAQRPGSPATGAIRYNTTENRFEGYNGSAWLNLSPANVDELGGTV